jgi:hypothetical protein
VNEIKSDGTLILQDGRAIPSHFRQFSHGYATTSHAAQGKTLDQGILILGEKGIQAANLKQAYVSNSRFRQSQTIFTINKPAAFPAMSTYAERLLAVETVKTDNPTPALTPQEASFGEKNSIRRSLDWSTVESELKVGIFGDF